MEALSVRFRDVEFVPCGAESAKDAALVRQLTGLEPASTHDAISFMVTLPYVIRCRKQQTVATFLFDLLVSLGYGFNTLMPRYEARDTIILEGYRFGPDGPDFGPEEEDRGDVQKHRDIYVYDFPLCLTRVRMIIHPDRMHRKAYAEERLVQKAIAAFQENVKNTGKRFEKEVFYGMLFLDSSSPVFYKIPVTRRLAKLADWKVVPPFETVVDRFDPQLPGDAMASPELREKVINYLLGFKKLLHSRRFEEESVPQLQFRPLSSRYGGHYMPSAAEIAGAAEEQFENASESELL